MGKTFTITINGDRWKYRSLSESEFLEVHPEMEDALAVTVPAERRIDFIGQPLFGRIFHELTHAYISYLNMDGTEMKPHDVEELITSMLEQRVDKMIEQAKKMLAKLQGDKDVNGKEVRSRKAPNVPDLGESPT